MAEWQPIETAPRDGTEILASVWTDKGTCIWMANGYMDGDEWDFGFACEAYDNAAPTHWMPLPPPPAEGE